jgi:predicted  nucleic acid-binding Zn-ribbon protein
VPGLKGLVCAVGRAPEGIDFDAIDRNPVQLIFLICYPPVEQTTYLNFIATIARIVRDPQNKKALLAGESADKMLEILEETSKAFSDNHEEALRQVQADPDVENVPDAHADLILLARLQLWQESLANARSGKKEIQKRIDAIRGLVSPRVLKHFDRLSKACPPALVAVEGDTCQGCFMRLHSKFVQEVRQDTTHIHTCTNCSRYIYVV